MSDDVKIKPVWECKIGVLGNLDMPSGADEIMRQAVQQAFRKVTGVDAQFVFSGWSARLTPGQRDVVLDRKPVVRDLSPRCTLCGYGQNDCHCTRFGWR